MTSDLSVTQRLYLSVEAGVDAAFHYPRSRWEGPDGSAHRKPSVTYRADPS